MFFLFFSIFDFSFLLFFEPFSDILPPLKGVGFSDLWGYNILQPRYRWQSHFANTPIFHREHLEILLQYIFCTIYICIHHTSTSLTNIQAPVLPVAFPYCSTDATLLTCICLVHPNKPYARLNSFVFKLLDEFWEWPRVKLLAVFLNTNQET